MQDLRAGGAVAAQMEEAEGAVAAQMEKARKACETADCELRRVLHSLGSNVIVLVDAVELLASQVSSPMVSTCTARSAAPCHQYVTENKFHNLFSHWFCSYWCASCLHIAALLMVSPGPLLSAPCPLPCLRPSIAHSGVSLLLDTGPCATEQSDIGLYQAFSSRRLGDGKGTAL